MQLRKPLTRAVQRFGRSAAGKSAGRRAYDLASRLAGAALARLPGVDGVYVTGSTARLEALEPGYSDIDLVLLVDVPSLDAELSFRRKLRERLRTLNRAGPLFRNVDYIEVQDFELFRHLGDAWAIDLDTRWRAVAGQNRLETPAFRPQSERRLEALIRAARRWSKSSPLLLDPRSGREPFIELRAARRLLGDALAGLTLGDRYAPLPELLERAAEHGVRGAVLDQLVADHRTALRGGRDTIVELVAASLEAIEQLAHDVTETWSEGCPVRVAGQSARRAATANETGGALADVPEEARAVALAAMARDFRAVVQPVSTGASRGGCLFVVSRSELAPHEAVATMYDLMAESPPLPPERYRWNARPILVTDALWRAAALFDPIIALVAGLAAKEALLCGAAPPFRWPSAAADRDAIVTAAHLALFLRPRSRAFRYNVTEARALEALKRDVTGLAPFLSQIRGAAGASTLNAGPGEPLTEAAALERLREWLAAQRPWLRERVAERTSRSAAPVSPPDGRRPQTRPVRR